MRAGLTELEKPQPLARLVKVCGRELHHVRGQIGVGGLQARSEQDRAHEHRWMVTLAEAPPSEGGRFAGRRGLGEKPSSNPTMCMCILTYYLLWWVCV